MVLFLLVLMAGVCVQSRGGASGGAKCRCVPADLCADDDDAGDGQDLLDIRLQKACQNYFEICCENPVLDLNLPDEPPTYKGCGFQKPLEILSRVTSGSKNAGFAELPWTAVVLMRDVVSDRSMYKCGGSLIHTQVVLTAAHCVVEITAGLLTVRAGEWDTKSQEEPLPHQDRSVMENLIHPNFKSDSLKNDIALLFLNEPFVRTHSIGLICLPPPYFNLDESLCTVGGYGKDSIKKGKYSTILKKVDLPLVPKDKCVSALRRTRLGNSFKLHKSFVCAGGEANKDTCKGDGGSPLICPIPGEEGRFFQIGIVAWGIGCGEEDIPGVYVNVPLFSKWIDDELILRGIDNSLYKY